jgi:hypothetical protein
LTGLSRFDPILADIRSAVREGYFDRQAEQDPSELARTPVEELLQRVEMMSPTRRKNHLAEIGDFRTDSTRTLSGKQGRTKEVTARWLSKK